LQAIYESVFPEGLIFLVLTKKDPWERIISHRDIKAVETGKERPEFAVKSIPVASCFKTTLRPKRGILTDKVRVPFYLTYRLITAKIQKGCYDNR